jgi:hypothetical protein
VVKSILLVLTENFDDMMFLTSQVILEEKGYDVIICSIKNGTAKGQDSSVMTVALSEAINQREEYDAIVLVDGSDFSNWDLLTQTLDDFNTSHKVIGFTPSSKMLVERLNFDFNSLTNNITVQDNLVYLSNLDDAENFVEEIGQLLDAK